MEDPKLAQAIESIAPLLVRANAAAKRLSEARYDDEPQWRVEVSIRVTHGLSDLERLRAKISDQGIPDERLKVDTKVRAMRGDRWLRVDEVEAIVRELLGE